jgi:tRNA (uracil-5-)-methyltransferase TRM9
MQIKIVEQLIELNQRFYQTFGNDFSQTRARVQPGVRQIMKDIPSEASILDLGCGNGSFSRALANRWHSGSYIGIDSSEVLLEAARKENPHSNSQFLTGDLTSLNWSADLNQKFDIIVSFAVLHHIPGVELRSRMLNQVRTLLAPEGRFIFSVWNFLASERLKKRIVAWEDADIKPSEVDPGDFLMDWRRGGFGLRYVHSFDDDELNSLAQECSFSCEQRFLSDGQGCQLGRYQVWR